MAYSELIKNFEHIREYMREFYVYGFKSRMKYNKKSPRSYDDERRRLESWLGGYMGFHMGEDGKNVFISIDSRAESHNPLYKALKSKSFTDGDITLHFIIFDILYNGEISLSLSEIIERIDKEYLSNFEMPMVFDESTLRKKLSEYEKEGIIVSEKRGRKMFYRRAPSVSVSNTGYALDFFSETAPCGVIGSFLLDKEPPHESPFAFKHNYITHAIDSGVLCDILYAMRDKYSITVKMTRKYSASESSMTLVPLRIYIGAQNGRQHLMAYDIHKSRFISCRIDNIFSVRKCDIIHGKFDELRSELNEKSRHIWGVICGNDKKKPEHVEFTVHIDDGEAYIVKRLEREKRCGSVEMIDRNTYRFTADIYDTSEILPWIRTFICRITQLRFSNRALEKRFRDDIHQMYRMYGIECDTEEGSEK